MADHSRPLLDSEVADNPFRQFAAWYAEASTLVRLPEAMAVASATPDGAPSVRMVLMKAWDERGFVFYTQYRSRKAAELDANPRAALLFHWDELGRQVRIEGACTRVSAEESDAYFATRPLGAQLGAHASEQSRTIESREELDERVRRLAETYAGRPVPRPAFWGGYRVTPEVFEFWQNREDRLHDRLRYRAVGDRWRLERLQP